MTNANLSEDSRIDSHGVTHGWAGKVGYIQLDHMEPEFGFGSGPEPAARELFAHSLKPIERR